jgi:UDP-N-acetylglucosamine 2-epimerase (non-hydrolysing)
MTFGTRPEALKLAPVISKLREHTETFQPQVCVTAQHRQMLDQVLDLFSIKPDFDLNLMEQGQSLAQFASRALIALDGLFRQERPDIVVVQGDTTTTFAAALAGFYNSAAVAHVEAGLRSFSKRAPFPEEINRRLASHLTDLHFAPTEGARDNLIREGVEADRIFVTGNTIVDTLQQVVLRLDSGLLFPPLRERFPELPSRFILVTVHRRENHGRNLREICRAVRELNDLLPGTHFFFPVHLNPQVHEPVRETLAGLPRVHLMPPLDYTSFVWLMQHSDLILSDSGGIQEECCALGKRVLVMREVTERYEAVESGFASLVGCDKDRIVTAAFESLTNKRVPELRVQNPFGDGRAAERIVAALALHACQSSQRRRCEPSRTPI